MCRILIFILLFPLGAQSQERISMITDRDLYFAGDLIWLSASCKPEGDLSKMLLVELLDGREVFARAKFPIREGRASGAIRIPEGAPGRNYQLRAYTNWQRNFPPEYYCTHELTILNPATPMPRLLLSWQAPPEEREALGFKVEGMKDRYGPREEVGLRLSSPLALDAVVSVVKKGTVRGNRPIHSPAQPEMPSDSGIMPGLLPDIRDVSLTGVVEDSATGLPAAGAWVYVSTTGGPDGQQLHLFKTDEKGLFVFPLHHLTGMQKIAVSSGLENRVRILSDFADRYADFPSVATATDTTLRQLFEEIYLNSQLERKYLAIRTDSAGLPPPVRQWFGRPVASVALKDFIPLPTMEDVFSEIVPFVSVRKKNRQHQLWVLDREETGFDPSPLVLIDNVPVFDLEGLMQINPAQVDRIEVINEPYLLGSHSISSLISITTSTPDFAGLKFPASTVFLNYQTREAPLVFPPVAYETSGSRESRAPDFRTVLYWTPRATIGPEGMEISFFTSDHESEYTLLVRGWDEEGREVFWEKDFSVGRED